MKTYYILDTDTNTWSQEHRPLKEITSMPGITGGHLLADARSRQTLTVAQALVSSRKAGALKAPSVPLLKLPSAASGLAGESPQKNKQSAPTIPIQKNGNAVNIEYWVLRMSALEASSMPQRWSWCSTPMLSGGGKCSVSFLLLMAEMPLPVRLAYYSSWSVNS